MFKTRIKRNGLQSFALAVLVLTSLVLAGCGYHVVGKGSSSLFTNIKTMAIPVFVNETRRADVESTLTNAIVDEFVNIVEITNAEKAEVVLEGVITGYTLGAVSYTGRDVANEYRLTVVLSLRLVRRAAEGGEDEILWEARNLSDYEDFTVDGSDIAATRDGEKEAFEKLADDVARLVREHMLEGF
jgi:outer membrane lipopolysaccharide assembly protein LptE/RlpB